jgi:4-hydroxyphenylacetate 3-monooxygenase
MPNQSLLYSGRVLACSQLHEMMHIARELCGGQICVTPDRASFESPDTKPWLDKFYSVNDDWVADDRRKLLAFARDLLNSDYAGHRLTFQLFAQAPPFAHLAAVYRNFDWDGPLDFVKKAANLSDRVMEPSTRVPGDGAVTQWYGANPPAAAPQSPPAAQGQAAAPSPAASAAAASVVRLAGANSRVA